MGFNFRRFIRSPVRAIVRVVKNPASKIIPANIRTTKVYKKIGRPIIKVGAGIALGAVTGGIGLAGFAGLSAAGAVAGGVSSALAGGLNSKGFSPIKNALLPAAAGFLAGSASRNITEIKAATQSAKQVATSAIKKEAARVVAKATPAALFKTAGAIAGSKLAQAAQRKSAGNTLAIDQMQQIDATAQQGQAAQITQASATKSNGIALATAAVVAVSVLAG